MSDEQAQDRRALRVRLAPEPASVPGARRFVAAGLRAWGHEALVDDATLCVSELAGNAALHGSSTYIEVCVLDLQEAVRLWVEDDGPTPAAAVAPRTSLPGLDDDPDDNPAGDPDKGIDEELDLLLDAPATGRGLAIVSVLASDWGVEELEQGKRVWADLAAPDAGTAATAVGARTTTAEAGRATVPAVASSPENLPEDWVVVTLAGCPVGLSLRQDQHLDELVRELTLIHVGRHDEESVELGQRLEAILRAPAHARDVGRRQARAAGARGEAFVDVEMAMPRLFSQEVRKLHEAVRAADALCEGARLLTLASPPEMRVFRDWMTAEIVGQVEQAAEPVTWLDWVAVH